MLLCAAAGAHAHLLNMSKATITVAGDGAVSVELALDLLLTAGSRERYYELSQHPAPMQSPEIQALLKPLADAIQLSVDDRRLTLALTELRFPVGERGVFLDPLSWPRAELRLEGQLELSGTERPSLQVIYTDAFRFEEPIASTMIDVAGDRSQTRWLVTGQRSPRFVLRSLGGALGGASVDLALSENASAQTGEAAAVFGDLLVAGFRHIFPDGVDHLLFVAALFFGSASVLGLVGIITLFTLAHSTSLGMTALGWISAPAAIVEPLILLSILWVSISNLRRPGHSTGRRYTSVTIVVLFGLVHGLGFAAALRDIGLPTDYLLTGLAAFNLGVEAAQLTFLAALALAAFVSVKIFGANKHWQRGGSIAVIVATALLIATRFS